MEDETEENSSIELEILAATEHERLGDIGSQIAEFGLDAIMEDGLLRDFPILGVLVGGARVAGTIRDRLFAKKVFRFLQEVSDLSEFERRHFIEEISESMGGRDRAGEALMLLMDRLDHIDKPKIIGRICRARIERKISFQEMVRFWMIVDRAFLPDLVSVSKYKAQEKVEDEVGPHMESLGLVKMVGMRIRLNAGSPVDSSNFTWHVSVAGRRFLDICFPSQ